MASDNPPAPFLEALKTNKPRKPRKQSEYSTQERSIMSKYKEEYKAKTGKERENVLRGKVLVDIFNFWHSKGVELDEPETEKRITVGEYIS